MVLYPTFRESDQDVIGPKPISEPRSKLIWRCASNHPDRISGRPAIWIFEVLDLHKNGGYTDLASNRSKNFKELSWLWLIWIEVVANGTEIVVPFKELFKSD